MIAIMTSTRTTLAVLTGRNIVKTKSTGMKPMSDMETKFMVRYVHFTARRRIYSGGTSILSLGAIAIVIFMATVSILSTMPFVMNLNYVLVWNGILRKPIIIGVFVAQSGVTRRERVKGKISLKPGIPQPSGRL